MTSSHSQARKGDLAFSAADAAEMLARAVIEADPDPLAEHHWQKALLGPMRDFLSRPGREFRASIVECGWTIAGRELAEMPPTLPMALELLHAGSLIIDDIQDESEMRRGQPALHRRYGTPVAINTGNWLYFAASTLIDDLEVTVDAKLALLRILRRAVLRCHQGQALDLSAKISTLDRGEIRSIVSATTTLKTASLVELAACLGAIAAGASDSLVRQLEDFGRELGIALQTLDDLGGVLSDRRSEKGNEDLRGGRPSWTWVFVSEACTGDSLGKLLQMAASVEQGDAPDPLRECLREALPANTKRRVTGRLADAFQKFCADVPPSPGREALKRVVERLEVSYD